MLFAADFVLIYIYKISRKLQQSMDLISNSMTMILHSSSRFIRDSFLMSGTEQTDILQRLMLGW